MLSRRFFLKSTGGVAAVTVLPFGAIAAGHSEDVFATNSGEVSVHPVSHASFVLKTPGMVIYNDPVGDPALYADFPAADLVLISHEHGDHFNADTLAAVVGDTTQLLVNPAVFGKLSPEMQAKASVIANGEGIEIGGIQFDAIPAYNLTEERLNYHPQGRDNGYILTVDGLRIYIAGDTEDIPEMRALENIDVAFVPMNLPYTMAIEAAADAVAEFKPTYVYPYHYGSSDIEAFTALLDGTETVVKRGPWYS